MSRIVHILFWTFFISCQSTPFTQRAAYTLVFKASNNYWYELYAVKDSDTISTLQSRLAQQYKINGTQWPICLYNQKTKKYVPLDPTKKVSDYQLSTLPYVFLSNNFTKKQFVEADLTSYTEIYGQDYIPNTYTVTFHHTTGGKNIYLFGVKDTDTITDLQARLQQEFKVNDAQVMCFYDKSIPAYFQLAPDKMAQDYSLGIVPYCFLSSSYIKDYPASTDLSFYTAVYDKNYIPPLAQAVSAIGPDLVEKEFGSYYNPFSSPPAQQQVRTLSTTTTNLKSKNLVGADLSNHDWSNYDFSGANLTNANFSASTVANANFTGANLQGANFEQCDITPAQLFSAQTFIEAWFSGNNQFKNVDFSTKLLTKCSFENCDLTGAIFDNTELSGTDFGNATLTHASFVQAHMDANTSFESAVLDQANFTKSLITAALLKQALSYKNINLTSCDFSKQDLTGCNLSNCNLTSTDLTDTNCTHVDFSRATVTPAQLSTTQTLLGATLSYLVLDGLNYAKKSIANATIRNSSCKNAIFDNATLDGITFINTDCTGSSFDKASLHQPIFQNSIFKNAHFTNTTSLTAANFTSCNIEGTTFEWANPTNTHFDDTTLYDIQLRQAFGPTLPYKTTVQSSPNYSKLKNAVWNNDLATIQKLLSDPANKFTRADGLHIISDLKTSWWEPSSTASLSVEQFRYRKDLLYASIRNSASHMAILDYLNNYIDTAQHGNADFTLDLTSTKGKLFICPFDTTTLDTNLRVTTNEWQQKIQYTTDAIAAISFYTLTYLDPKNTKPAGSPHSIAAMIGTHYSEKDFSMITRFGNVGNNQFTKWGQVNFNIHFKGSTPIHSANNQDFSKQNLSHQWFDSVTFQNCNFSNAVVQNSYFEESDLSGSNLSNANFTQSNLRKCNLSNTNCTNARMAALLHEANFTNALLTNASFAYSTGFTGTQLMQAQKDHAGISIQQLQSFQHCDFSNHNFSHSDISGTNLSFSTCDTTDFSFASATSSVCNNTSFKNANLSNANFNKANLTQADLRGANLTKTDFRQADLRQAIFSSKDQLKNAITDKGTRLDKVLKIK